MRTLILLIGLASQEVITDPKETLRRLAVARIQKSFAEAKARAAAAQAELIEAQVEMEATRRQYVEFLKQAPGYRDGCEFDGKTQALVCPPEPEKKETKK